MTEDKIFLLTTALDHAYKSDESYLFLGEWCSLYSRRKAIKNISYQLLSYHWDDRKKAYADFKYLEILNKQLLQELSVILNNIHGKKYSEKTWNVLIGYWLTQFTAVVFDRWSMIDCAVKKYDNLETVILDIKSESCVPNDSSEAGQFFINDRWNHHLYGILIKKWSNIKTIQKQEAVHSKVIKKNKYHDTVLLRLKKQIKVAINWLLNLPPRSSIYIFGGAYLSFFDKIKLILSLKGAVNNRLFFDSEKIELDVNFRKWNMVNDTYNNKFEEIVRSLLPEFMPKTFLEGFQGCNNENTIKSCNQKEKVIFTSGYHFSSDVFKRFYMEKIENGVRLVIGQHGGGPLHKYNGGTTFELAIADAYLSTGSGNCKKNSKIKNIGQLFNRLKYNKYNKNGCALLVTVAMPRYSFDLRSMAIAGQMIGYFEDQFAFYGALTNKIKEQLNIRLYSSDYDWGQKQRWMDYFPAVKFDSNKKMDKSIGQSRLVIATYAATTYNQTLASNIPTIIYWNPEHWELSVESDLFFEEMKRVGIFHTTPQSAAQQVVKIWDDIDKWWYSPDLQSVREKYCRAFAHKPKDLVKKIKRALVEEAHIYD
jgi:putative transferase (TIGR04331 family)